MNKVIVTDIFGKTSALLSLAKAINAETIIDPYEGQMLNFSNEAHAYQHFSENVGVNAYVNKLSKIMAKYHHDTTLIGFSVGAAAIWQLSEVASVAVTKRIHKAICFYGSQIRYQTQVSPNFDVTLILPKHEPHFDVLILKHQLEHKAKVTVEQVQYLHGFMNLYSDNFDQLGYNEYLDFLVKE